MLTHRTLAPILYNIKTSFAHEECYAVINDGDIMPKVIKSGLLIVHPDQEPIHRGVVVVADGQIVSVGKEDEVNIPEDADVVDCSDWTVMPGLVDSHVHITINNRFQLPLSAHFDFDETTAALRGAMNLRSDLASGVTTMRTLGDRPGVE